MTLVVPTSRPDVGGLVSRGRRRETERNLSGTAAIEAQAVAAARGSKLL